MLKENNCYLTDEEDEEDEENSQPPHGKNNHILFYNS